MEGAARTVTHAQIISRQFGDDVVIYILDHVTCAGLDSTLEDFSPWPKSVGTVKGKVEKNRTRYIVKGARLSGKLVFCCKK